MPGLSISTIGDLIDDGYTMHAWCYTCQRGAAVDLHALAEKYGRDTTYIKPASPIRLRCSRCGARNCDANISPSSGYNE